MVTKKVYEKLKDNYWYTSSWAIWSIPSNGNFESKDSIDDLKMFDNAGINNTLRSLNGNFIFVGLNPSEPINSNTVKSWGNFHSSNKKRSQDYKLRCALYGTPYWGSFMMDIYPDDPNPDSPKVESGNVAKNKESIARILDVFRILGGKPTIIAMGNKAYTILKKELPTGVCLKRITHYAAYIGASEYRDKVHKELGLKP